MTDPLREGALALAARVRAREISSRELVEAHVRRIQEVNPVLNALVADRFDEARREAAAADRALADGGPAGPLHGVPFTVKEMVSLAGMPHTFGTLRRRDRVAERDAEVVRRLRAAGAIPLGVTNVPEWGFWFETYNPIFGRTRNPYDPSRTCGGSSGGEGALIGAGASPFGVGSDIGGSIRMPAAFCGVFGHKPTPGLLPLTGHYPVYEAGPDAGLPRRAPYQVVGPLARTARDLLPLLRIMAGPDGVDPNAEAIPLREADEAGWRGRAVYLLDDPRIRYAGRATAEVRDAVRRAARVLEARGAVVEPLPAGIFHRAAALWAAALGSQAGRSFAETLGVPRRRQLYHELGMVAVRRPRYSLPVLLFALLEQLTATSERRKRELVEEGVRLTERVAGLLGGGAVLLLPPHPRVAPRHDRPLLRPFDFVFTAVLNLLRLPATVAPMGRGSAGLPLSVQVAAARGSDHLTVAAALALEEEIGGWTPPA